jgi:hypothetical protein
MAETVAELRLLTQAGTADYLVSGVSYWTDEQMQRILDNHRTDLKWNEMTAIQEGDSAYYDYSIGYGNLEATSGGTAIFIVQDLNGATVISPTYTVDYQRGVVTFSSDTLGELYWVTARSYDVNAAAAEVWRKKQTHFAGAYDFSTDGHNISRSQLYEHAKEMTSFYERQGSGGFGSVEMMRSDTDDA